MCDVIYRSSYTFISIALQGITSTAWTHTGDPFSLESVQSMIIVTNVPFVRVISSNLCSTSKLSIYWKDLFRFSVSIICFIFLSEPKPLLEKQPGTTNQCTVFCCVFLGKEVFCTILWSGRHNTMAPYVEWPNLFDKCWFCVNLQSWLLNTGQNITKYNFSLTCKYFTFWIL